MKDKKKPTTPKEEIVLPYPSRDAEGKKAQIASMFDAISERYDWLNKVLSARVDVSWRKRLLSRLRLSAPKEVLDVATGTADLALGAARLLPEARVLGIDISEGMLRVGRRKVCHGGLEKRITLLQQDAEAMDIETGRFDGVMVAFGIRNFERLDKGLQEMFRVLGHGGKVFILEFSVPRFVLFSALYMLYFHHILPLIGGFFSKDKSAYSYLPKSVSRFPQGEELLKHLKNAGFSKLSYQSLSLGIASLYEGEKNAS